MPRFRKKPVEIEAEQWFPGWKVDGVTPGPSPQGSPPEVPVLGYIHTLEGTMAAKPGDWIITGVKGEKYPCDDDIFRATYQPVDEEAARALGQKEK